MLRKQHRLKPLMLAELPPVSTACEAGSFLPIIQEKEPKPVGTVPYRFPLMSKGSARNSAVCRGLPCRTSTSTSTKPPANAQALEALEVLGVGPSKGTPREEGEDDRKKPHPTKGKSRVVKSVCLQAAAPVRKLRESSLDMTLEGEMVRRILPPVPPSSPILQPTPPPTDTTPERLARRCTAASIHRRDPTTDRHGGFDLLRFRPGPVHPSLGDLVVPSFLRITISIPNLARTPDRHSPLQPRTPELKRSASLSLPVAWITGARHRARREQSGSEELSTSRLNTRGLWRNCRHHTTRLSRSSCKVQQREPVRSFCLNTVRLSEGCAGGSPLPIRQGALRDSAAQTLRKQTLNFTAAGSVFTARLT
ncbi:hypothetical protein AOLI_G00151460 [Acnodon oligacanthus]